MSIFVLIILLTSIFSLVFRTVVIFNLRLWLGQTWYRWPFNRWSVSSLRGRRKGTHGSKSWAHFLSSSATLCHASSFSWVSHLLVSSERIIADWISGRLRPVAARSPLISHCLNELLSLKLLVDGDLGALSDVFDKFARHNGILTSGGVLSCLL